VCRKGLIERGTKLEQAFFFRETQRKFERKKIIGGTAIDKVIVNLKTKSKVSDFGLTVERVANDNILLLRVEEVDIILTQKKKSWMDKARKR